MSFKRKMMRRKMKESKKEFKSIMGMFDILPDKCKTCDAPYDRNNKEQANTWTVVVRESQKKVNLYCPTCWNQAKQTLSDIEDYLDAKTDS